MARNNKLNESDIGEAGPSIPQVDGSDSASESTPVKTRKRKTKGKGSVSATPGRRGGLRSGVTGANDSLPGPGPTPAAAFTTLRCSGSEPFFALLRQLNPSKKVVILKCEGSIRFQRLLQRLDAVSTCTFQPFQVDTKSPVDSAIDVLTPGICSITGIRGSEQPTEDDERMAPVRDISQAERDRIQQVASVSDSLRDIIQNYYELQAQVQGYVSETETKDVLVNKVQETAQSLAHLARESSNPAVTNTFVPPEVVDYVDDGRNPDIYTRELVEVVQRGNAVLNGKTNAFGTFSRIFANDIRKYFPDMAEEVNEIMGDDGKGAPHGNDNASTERPVKQENGGSSSRPLDQR